MSTPTPTAPLSASKTPALSAQTPRPHLQGASSTSTPRSMISPAMSRSGPYGSRAPSTTQAAKTPARTPGGIQMAPSLSQMSGGSASSSGLYAGAMTTSASYGTAGLGLAGAASGPAVSLGVSPGPAGQGLNFASPSFGLDIGTPSMLDPVAMGGLGTSAMNISLSDMGLARSGRSTDDERRHKLSLVLGKLLGRQHTLESEVPTASSGMGRISDEGVRRVGAWAGFDVEVEAKYNKPHLEGSRPIVIAGRNAILIDVNFQSHVARKVQVSFSSEQEAVTAHEKGAADVLLRDLTPGLALINSKLDRFAANLQILARLDKLSTTRFNCFEAITGVYTSLQRLYEHEKKAAEVLFGSDSTRARTHVMCLGSGVPSMNSSRRVGLTLDYFLDKSALISREASSTLAIDTSAPEPIHETFALELTLEPSDGQLYTPARNTSDWLTITAADANMTDPDPVSGLPEGQFHPDSQQESHTWLEPPQTYDAVGADPAGDPSSAEAVDADQISATTGLDIPLTSKQHLIPPNAIFVAKLHPPINVPFIIAGQLFQTVRSVAPLTLLQTSYLAACTLPSPSRMTSVLGTELRADLIARGGRTLATPTGDVEHEYSLYDLKPETAVCISRLPFEHPRQIVQVLPVLRQWGFVARLLRTVTARAFSNKANDERDDVALDELLDGTSPGVGPLQIDITVSATPEPTFTIAFLASPPRTLKRITFQVLVNAKVVILDQDLLDSGESDGQDAVMGDEPGPEPPVEDPLQKQSETKVRIERMARALEICGDLGTWIEWLRREHGR